MGKIEDVPKRTASEVRASTSQVSSGSVVPHEKLKLAFKLLGVSSRISRVVCTDPFCFYFLVGGARRWRSILMIFTTNVPSVFMHLELYYYDFY